MKLRLVVKTERQNTYCLRFAIPNGEQRYAIAATGSDRSVELSFKKSAAFGDSSIESAAADNSAWFAGLVVGDDWELKLTQKPAATETP